MRCAVPGCGIANRSTMPCSCSSMDKCAGGSGRSTRGGQGEAAAAAAAVSTSSTVQGTSYIRPCLELRARRDCEIQTSKPKLPAGDSTSQRCVERWLWLCELGASQKPKVPSADRPAGCMLLCCCTTFPSALSPRCSTVASLPACRHTLYTYVAALCTSEDAHVSHVSSAASATSLRARAARLVRAAAQSATRSCASQPTASARRPSTCRRSASSHYSNRCRVHHRSRQSTAGCSSRAVSAGSSGGSEMQRGGLAAGRCERRHEAQQQPAVDTLD